MNKIRICVNITYTTKYNHGVNISVNYNHNSKSTYIYSNEIISLDMFYHVLRNGHQPSSVDFGKMVRTLECAYCLLSSGVGGVPGRSLECRIFAPERLCWTVEQWSDCVGVPVLPFFKYRAMQDRQYTFWRVC